jgi:hypothetical protein
MADDPAGAAFDTTLIREDHTAVWLRCITGRGTAIDTLLPFTLQADIVVDDEYVRPVRIDVEAGNCEFSFQSGAILDSILYDCHVQSCLFASGGPLAAGSTI